MQKPKMISIQLKSAKQMERLLDKYEEMTCVGCLGVFHEENCPAREATQLRNYLTQRINNPSRNFSG